MMNAVEQTHAGGGRGGFASGSGHGRGDGVRTGVASAGPSLRSTSCEVRVFFSPCVSEEIWKCQNQIENADQAILLARKGLVATLRSWLCRDHQASQPWESGTVRPGWE